MKLNKLFLLVTLLCAFAQVADAYNRVPSSYRRDKSCYNFSPRGNLNGLYRGTALELGCSGRRAWNESDHGRWQVVLADADVVWYNPENKSQMWLGGCKNRLVFCEEEVAIQPDVQADVPVQAYPQQQYAGIAEQQQYAGGGQGFDIFGQVANLALQGISMFDQGGSNSCGGSDRGYRNDNERQSPIYINNSPVFNNNPVNPNTNNVNITAPPPVVVQPPPPPVVQPPPLRRYPPPPPQPTPWCPPDIVQAQQPGQFPDSPGTPVYDLQGNLIVGAVGNNGGLVTGGGQGQQSAVASGSKNATQASAQAPTTVASMQKTAAAQRGAVATTQTTTQQPTQTSKGNVGASQVGSSVAVAERSTSGVSTKAGNQKVVNATNGIGGTTGVASAASASSQNSKVGKAWRQTVGGDSATQDTNGSRLASNSGERHIPKGMRTQNPNSLANNSSGQLGGARSSGANVRGHSGQTPKVSSSRLSAPRQQFSAQRMAAPRRAPRMSRGATSFRAPRSNGGGRSFRVAGGGNRGGGGRRH